MEEMLKRTDFNASGQVLLIVVVTMIVALTAGLTIASRTITNLKLSKQNEESQKAFQAASSGIEKFLNAATGSNGSGDLDSATFATTVLTQDAPEYLLNNAAEVDQDRGMDIWLSSHPDYSNQYDGTFVLNFGTNEIGNVQSCAVSSGKNVMPALEIVMLTGTVTTPTLSKYVYDPCPARRTNNNFSAPNASTATIGGVNFQHVTPSISVTNGLIARVVPLYNSAVIGISWTPNSGIPIPVQGKLLESTGKSGETQRKIVYFESLPQIPAEVFPYAIISQ